jgi:hypothetical protein
MFANRAVKRAQRLYKLFLRLVSPKPQKGRSEAPARFYDVFTATGQAVEHIHIYGGSDSRFQFNEHTAPPLQIAQWSREEEY